ncbi:MAG: ArgE/DapE family deacylase [Rhodospirillales bacterium]|nr:ArgE/DapE family deacylase [Rhodospirillales bacterium]
MSGRTIDEAALADELVAILGHLIALPSTVPPGDTREIAAFVSGRLRSAGYATETASRAEGLDNVVATLGTGEPWIVFNVHADTVDAGSRADWRTDPFEGVRDDGRVIGLGAANCKGGMAVHLWLAEEIARRGGPSRGRVSFTFVADEETMGPDGARFLRDTGLVAPDVLVVAAPTANRMVVTERGVLWVRITATGRSAHAGDPDAGDNAIMRMARVIRALEDGLGPRLAGRREGALASTMNLGLIRGGNNTNVVPAGCLAEVDRRLLPGEDVDAAFAEITEIVEGAGEPEGTVRTERLLGTNGYSARADGAAVAALGAAIEGRTGTTAELAHTIGASDGRYFADDGIEIIGFGPGDDAEGHAANESVPVAALVDAARIQLQAVDALLELGRSS